MRKFLDETKGVLVFVTTAADENFWDNHWMAQSEKLELYKESGELTLSPIMSALRRVKRAILGGSIVLDVSKKYLNPRASVLEGGCGLGQEVLKLSQQGYDARGIDYTPQTVNLVREKFPDLQIDLGDIMELPYGDDQFDAYWSLGVIEHFLTGFTPIVNEMTRVLKPGGYAFMIFPQMSLLRRLKASLSCYDKIAFEDIKTEQFYQFALKPLDVVSQIESHGFELVEIRSIDGIKGLKDEISFFRGFLQPLFEAKNPLARALRKVLEHLINPFCGHQSLLVLKKL